MKNFYLLNMEVAMRINKQIRLTILEFLAGLFVMFLMTFIPGTFGALLKQYLLFIALGLAVLIMIVNFIMLYSHSPKNRETLMSIDDSKIILKSKMGQRELYIMGMAYVEVDLDSYRPGVLVSFIYSETNQTTVMIHSNQYNDFVATVSELRLHLEKKRNP